VPQQFGEIVEGVDTVQLAGMDQSHEQIAYSGAIQRLVEQGVSSVKYGLLQNSFDQIMPRPGLCRAAGSSDAPACLPMIADAA